MSRPEHLAPPEVFYNDKEAKKYSGSSRMLQIQAQMTTRALELLNLPDDGAPKLLLDIGCGSGLSGEVLEESGHLWIGCDISRSMLETAREREVDADLFEHDMGQGVSFRAGVFDGVISISALQWLCNADKTGLSPRKRLRQLFTTLYGCMRRGARAVFQFYPENPEQMELINQCALQSGFSGGLVVDYPNSARAKKYFLCLFAGHDESSTNLPSGLGTEEGRGHSVAVAQRERSRKRRRGGNDADESRKSKVLRKKEKTRRRGHETKRDSKYTGRRRKAGF